MDWKILFFLGFILEFEEFFMRAIGKYEKAYSIQLHPGVAFRIACSYESLELEELKNEWNRKIQDVREEN